MLMALCFKSGGHDAAHAWGLPASSTSLATLAAGGDSERLNKIEGSSWQAVMLPSAISAVFFSASFARLVIMRQLILTVYMMWAAGMLGDSETIS